MSVPLQISRKRIKRDIETLAVFTDPNEQGFTRLSFSKEYRDAVDYVAGKMAAEAELEVRIDEIGNLIGRKPGINENLPCLMIGSHLDTVKAGGKYDGIAGVIAGLEIARCLYDQKICLKHPLEIVGFLAEEPSPFGKSTIGSRAMTGKLELETLKKATNQQGKSLYQALKEAGGNPDKLEKVIRKPGSIASYWELHIEQGPVLDQQKIPIGVVSGIAAIVRAEITIVGESNHAGTTPMAQRKDALTAGASLVTAIDSIAREYDRMVITVGEFEIDPNFSNIIPGKVKMGLDLRSLDEDDLASAIQAIQDVTDGIKTNGLGITFNHWRSSPRVVFPREMTITAEKVCKKMNIPYLVFPSGAGHDASYLSEIAPSGMIFIPSKGGLSHCPQEHSDLSDIVKGVEVLSGVIQKLDSELSL